MLKFLGRIDWLPLTVAALILIGSMSILSSMGYPEENQDNHAQRTTNQKQAGVSLDATDWTVIFTGTLAFSTIGLWFATYRIARDQQQTNRKVRSVIGGGGERIRHCQYPNTFKLVATNAGHGSAVLQKMQWGFGDLKDASTFPVPPVYSGHADTHEPLYPGQKQDVRYLEIHADGFKQPVIFVRFDYLDVNRRQKVHVCFAMIIDGPEYPPLPIPTFDVPGAYLENNFPLEPESEC